MKNVGQDPKIVKKITKNVQICLGGSKRNLLIFRGVFVIIRK